MKDGQLHSDDYAGKMYKREMDELIGCACSTVQQLSRTACTVPYRHLCRQGAEDHNSSPRTCIAYDISVQDAEGAGLGSWREGQENAVSLV